MSANTETVREDAKWSESGGTTERRRGAPIGVLGFAALGLWGAAVALGVGAPLLGLEIDSRIVVGVLVASGVVSLLSLPITAWTPGASAKKREPTDRHG